MEIVSLFSCAQDMAVSKGLQQIHFESVLNLALYPVGVGLSRINKLAARLAQGRVHVGTIKKGVLKLF